MDYISPTHQDILDVLNQINVQVVINNHPICYSREYDGYVLSPKNYRNNSNQIMMLLCVDTMREYRNDWKREVGYTISHEAVHVAQLCKSGDGYFSTIGDGNDIEKESYDLQDNPEEVLRVLKKYCL